MGDCSDFDVEKSRWLMMDEWKKRPTSIESVPSTVEHIVAIDESGTSDLKHIYKSLSKGKSVSPDNSHFTVGACIIRGMDFLSCQEIVMKVKKEHWENGYFIDKKGKEARVCFHSREIRKRENAFAAPSLDYSRLLEDISQMISSLKMKLLFVDINKVELVEKYQDKAQNPYEIALKPMLFT